MFEKCNRELKMATIIFVCLAVAASADKVLNEKEIPIPSENAPAEMHNEHHVVAKRAWKQLQSGWGKRNLEEDPREETLDDLKRNIMKLYSEQLLSNRVADNDYAPDEFDGTAEKRAWKSMSNAWGKRDWSQLRGNGWGKRSPGWNKLSSAWGK